MSHLWHMWLNILVVQILVAGQRVPTSRMGQ